MKTRMKAILICIIAFSLLIGCGNKEGSTESKDDVIITAGDSSTSTGTSSDNKSAYKEDSVNKTDTEKNSDENKKDNKDTEKEEATTETSKSDEYDGLDIPSEATMDDNIRGGWINDDGDLFEFLGSGDFSAYIASENLQWKGTYETDNMSYVKLKYKVYDNSKVVEDKEDKEETDKKETDKKDNQDNNQGSTKKEENDLGKENTNIQDNINDADSNKNEEEEEEFSEEIISDGSGKVTRRVYNSKGELVSEEDYTKEFYSKNKDADDPDKDKLVSDKETELTYELKFSDTLDSSNNKYKILTLVKGKSKFKLIKQYNI